MSRNFVLAACLLPWLAIPAVANLTPHEQLASVPSGWSQATKLPEANTSIHLSISVTLQNMESLASALKNISTPGESTYGQYQDVDEVLSRFGPAKASTDAVLSWLNDSEISSVYKGNKYSVDFLTTVEQANSLLNASFLHYTDGSIQKLRTLSYSIPQHLKEHIDFISPTTYFGTSTARNVRLYKSKRGPIATSISASLSSSSSVSVCQSTLTPNCVRQLYDIGNYTPSAESGSQIGFGSFLNHSAIYTDLELYEQYFGQSSQNFTRVFINNPINNQDPTPPLDAEANLDIQNIMGIAHPLPVTEFLTGGSPPFDASLDSPQNQNEPYIPYYEYLLSQQNKGLPQVISNSYDDEEQTVPLSYAIRTCNLIGLLGLRGITIIQSSADEGLGRGCLSNDGKNKTQFEVFFPSTCPYLLSIGGTQGIFPEIAWGAGSGGFSRYFPRPWYQDEAIKTYLGEVPQDTKSYYTNFTNFNGRGFPDVAAHSIGPGYPVFYKGDLNFGGGNSAAAPVWAAIIALLNDARLSVGKPALGFINPLLYYLRATALTDITAGGSVGCNGKNNTDNIKLGHIPWASWNATAGWDPVTGLGVPNFARLKELVLSI